VVGEGEGRLPREPDPRKIRRKVSRTEVERSFQDFLENGIESDAVAGLLQPVQARRLGRRRDNDRAAALRSRRS
jgi:hypothetical protein